MSLYFKDFSKNVFIQAKPLYFSDLKFQNLYFFPILEFNMFFTNNDDYLITNSALIIYLIQKNYLI
jgi:hypothetical protein